MGEEEEDKQPEPVEKPEFEKKLEEMKAENDRMEKNIAELKELKATDALSGNFDTAKKPEVKEETPQEYSNKLIAGKVEDAP